MRDAIPDEIMKEARKIQTAIRAESFGRASDCSENCDCERFCVARTEKIARALMARDKRAAGIAREHGDEIAATAILTYGDTDV